MWTLLWLLNGLCIGLMWLLGVVSLGSLLLMFGIYWKGRTVGVTRGEQVWALYGLVGFFGFMFAALGILGVAQLIQTQHDEAIGRSIEDLQAQCSTLGDSQPVPTPRRALLFKQYGESGAGTSWTERVRAGLAGGRSSLANRQLPSSLRGSLGSDMLVFSVLGPPHLAGERMAEEVIDVQVIRWPERTAIGQYQIEVRHDNPLDGLTRGGFFASGDETSLARWVSDLPVRPHGDRQRLLEGWSRSAAASTGGQP